MKITLSAQDITALSSMKSLGMSDSLKMLSRLQSLSLDEARAYYKKYRRDIPVETAAIIDRNIEAETRRLESIKKRRAAKKAAVKQVVEQPKAEKSHPALQPMTDAQRNLLKWIAANWKKITDFFSMQSHVDHHMSSRIACRYKELRAIIAQAPRIIMTA